MLFAVLFTDRPGQGAVRTAQLAAHIDWLVQHRAIVPVGGSLRQEPGDVPLGGLWMARAQSKAQLEALIQTAPLYQAGRRQSDEILHWSAANAERLELI